MSFAKSAKATPALLCALAATLGIMTQASATNREFELLARRYLHEHPLIRHEWHQVASFVVGDRTDLICHTGEGVEVFASLKASQITVGSGANSYDFEDYGRGISEVAVAREAFDKFVWLLHGDRKDA